MAWWKLFYGFLEGCYAWDVVLGVSYEGALVVVVMFDMVEHLLLVHMCEKAGTIL
jgi:hypothetical protein